MVHLPVGLPGLLLGVGLPLTALRWTDQGEPAAAAALVGPGQGVAGGALDQALL